MNFIDELDVRTGGAFLISQPDLNEDAPLPEPDPKSLSALLEDPRIDLSTVSPVNDITAAANQFLTEYDLVTLPEDARVAKRDGVLSVDPMTISTLVAVWILLQAEIQFEFSKNTEGKHHWIFRFKKKATASPALLSLVKWLKESLGL